MLLNRLRQAFSYSMQKWLSYKIIFNVCCTAVNSIVTHRAQSSVFEVVLSTPEREEGSGTLVKAADSLSIFTVDHSLVSRSLRSQIKPGTKV